MEKLGILCDCGCGLEVTKENRTFISISALGNRVNMLRSWAFVSPEHRDIWYNTIDGTNVFPVRTPRTLNPCSYCQVSSSFLVFNEETGEYSRAIQTQKEQNNFVICPSCQDTKVDSTSTIFYSEDPRDTSYDKNFDREMKLRIHVRDGEDRLGLIQEIEFATPTEMNDWWNTEVHPGEELPDLKKR